MRPKALRSTVNPAPRTVRATGSPTQICLQGADWHSIFETKHSGRWYLPPGAPLLGRPNGRFDEPALESGVAAHARRPFSIPLPFPCSVQVLPTLHHPLAKSMPVWVHAPPPCHATHSMPCPALPRLAPSLPRLPSRLERLSYLTDESVLCICVCVCIYLVLADHSAPLLSRFASCPAITSRPPLSLSFSSDYTVPRLPFPTSRFVQPFVCARHPYHHLYNSKTGPGWT